MLEVRPHARERGVDGFGVEDRRGEMERAHGVPRLGAREPVQEVGHCRRRLHGEAEGQLREPRTVQHRRRRPDVDHQGEQLADDQLVQPRKRARECTEGGDVEARVLDDESRDGREALEALEEAGVAVLGRVGHALKAQCAYRGEHPGQHPRDPREPRRALAVRLGRARPEFDFAHARADRGSGAQDVFELCELRGRAYPHSAEYVRARDDIPCL